MRVALDSTRDYEVPYSTVRWNGFAVPGFTLDQVHQIATDLADLHTALTAADLPTDEQDTVTVNDDNTISIHSGTYNETTILTPAPDGLSYLGAHEWAWQIID
jgi:hypothetical protein